MSEVGSMNEWVDLANKQQKGEDNCIPLFHFRPLHRKKESEVAGRPIYHDVAYVEIVTPGDKSLRPIVKVTDEHRERWPEQWAKFERSHDESQIDGTSIEDWPLVSRSQVMELKAIGFHTIESIAGASDANLAPINPGGMELRKRAQQYLKPQTDIETELRTEIETLKAKNKALEADNERMVLEEGGEEVRKRGRPLGSRNRPKEEDAA